MTAAATDTELSRDAIEVLKALLAAEYAAIAGYSTLGARLDIAARRLALAAFDAHRAARDLIAARLRAAGVELPAPLPAYDIPVSNRTEAVALAVRLEEGLAVRWRDLVGATRERSLRELAVQQLGACAIRAAEWRRLSGSRTPTVAFPGT